MIRHGAHLGHKGPFAAREHSHFPDSLWRAASTSKALTAVGIMRLVEGGQLDLDVDVNHYLRTLKVPATKSKPITLPQLLTHSSGLDDPFVGSGFLAVAGEQVSLATVMRNWLPARLYEPREVRLYSNFGYGLAGAVIEDVTGKRYEDFMRSEVLEPFGMDQLAFDADMRALLLDKKNYPARQLNIQGYLRRAAST
jgi:CubicO group peptidase (beta-lactamase class C family)